MKLYFQVIKWNRYFVFINYFVTVVIIDMNEIYFVLLPFVKICFVLFCHYNRTKLKETIIDVS